jgi:hypothetical protein
MYQQIGGAEYRVGDCHVWAEIFYLDSPTDYRECLPENNLHLLAGELQMLDEVWSPHPLKLGYGIQAGSIFSTTMRRWTRKFLHAFSQLR